MELIAVGKWSKRWKSWQMVVAIRRTKTAAVKKVEKKSRSHADER